MQNELIKLKTQIQEKEKAIVTQKDNLSKIKNESMTTDERLNELNKIYEVFISIKNYEIYTLDHIVNVITYFSLRATKELCKNFLWSNNWCNN